MINKIMGLLDKDEKKFFYYLIVFSFIAIFLETIGLAAFIPIIEFLTGEQVVGFDIFLKNLNFKNLDAENSIYFFITVLFKVCLFK